MYLSIMILSPEVFPSCKTEALRYLTILTHPDPSSPNTHSASYFLSLCMRPLQGYKWDYSVSSFYNWLISLGIGFILVVDVPEFFFLRLNGIPIIYI